MIYVGTDLVEIDRIQAAIDKWGQRFLTRIFTNSEIAYCSHRRHPVIHYAGRFAAKEAVKKAIYTSGHGTPIPFRHINVLRNGDGVLGVQMTQVDRRIQISMSHTDHYATATAILEVP